MSGSVAHAWKKLGSKCCKYTFTACKISSINSELELQKVMWSNVLYNTDMYAARFHEKHSK